MARRRAAIRVAQRPTSIATSSTPTERSFSTPRACSSSNDAFGSREGRAPLGALFLLPLCEHLSDRIHGVVQPVVVRRRIAIDLLKRPEVFLRHDQIHAVEKSGVAVQR